MNPNSLIREIMTKEPITVTIEDSLSRIRQIFEVQTFHHLPVLNEQKLLVGIVSREDMNKVVQLLAFDYKKVKHGPISARDIMTKSPIQLDPEDSIGLAADIFMSNKVHAIPVVERDVLLGIVTTHDLIKYCFTSPI